MASIGLEMPDVTSLGGVSAGAAEAAEAIDDTGTAAEKAAKKGQKSLCGLRRNQCAEQVELIGYRRRRFFRSDGCRPYNLGDNKRRFRC